MAGAPLVAGTGEADAASIRCPACAQVMAWSEYCDGPYQYGWKCTNEASCKGNSAKQLARWLCIDCEQDVCVLCAPAYQAPGNVEQARQVGDRHGLVQPGQEVDAAPTGLTSHGEAGSGSAARVEDLDAVGALRTASIRGDFFGRVSLARHEMDVHMPIYCEVRVEDTAPAMRALLNAEVQRAKEGKEPEADPQAERRVSPGTWRELLQLMGAEVQGQATEQAVADAEKLRKICAKHEEQLGELRSENERLRAELADMRHHLGSTPWNMCQASLNGRHIPACAVKNVADTLSDSNGHAGEDHPHGSIQKLLGVHGRDNDKNRELATRCRSYPAAASSLNLAEGDFGEANTAAKLTPTTAATPGTPPRSTGSSAGVSPPHGRGASGNTRPADKARVLSESLLEMESAARWIGEMLREGQVPKLKSPRPSGSHARHVPPLARPSVHQGAAALRPVSPRSAAGVV